MKLHRFNCFASLLFAALSLFLIAGAFAPCSVPAQEEKTSTAIDIGSQRQLFVDEYLIDSLEGGAELRIHHPTSEEVVMTHDEPWEGDICGYSTIFRDGNIYRMYYRGADVENRETNLYTHEEVTCYAKSKDGIKWIKPDLGIVPFDGSMKNNIILAGPNPHGPKYGSGKLSDYDARTSINLPLDAGRATHNFTPFKDANPDCKPEAQYKAVGGLRAEPPVGTGGLWAFQSADAIHWEPLHDGPVITQGAFDSQNLAFWDSVREEYRAYFRTGYRGVRAIATCTSKDFVNWSDPKHLDYGPDAPNEHVYTNCIRSYDRAPQLFIGFPTRYLPGRGSLTEGLLMSSRDGVHFHRWEEAFIRAGQNENKWGNRCNYIWWGLVETESDLPGAAPELSLYTNEHYYMGGGVQTRRHTIRKDGFVSFHAPYAGGEVATKPLKFEGKELEINYSTSAAGGIQIELQNAEGQPIQGFALEDCPTIHGDELDHVVEWKGGSDVSALAGEPVRLRIMLNDADLYSMRFR